MTKKTTYEDFQNMAKLRNHKLISISNAEIPSKGRLILYCQTCNTEFETSAASYKNARKTGCPSCKAIKARQQKSRPQVCKKNQSFLQSNSFAGFSEQISQTRSARFEKQQQWNAILDLEDLKAYLRQENNDYSVFILEKLDSSSSNAHSGCLLPEESSDIGSEQSNSFATTPLVACATNDEKIEVHHIIPKHAGGPDAKWNLLALSKADHVQAHLLRYQVYGEFGDYNFLKTQRLIDRGIPLNNQYELQLKQNRQKADQTRQQLQLGIYQPGMSQKAGKISGKKKKSLQHIYSHRYRMTEKVREVLYKTGSVWYHHSTDTTVVIQPKQALTMNQVRLILANALDENHENRKQLENTLRPVNVTSSLSKLIKNTKGRQKAYGFSFSPLLAGSQQISLETDSKPCS
jgi:hypothetical protein